MPLNAWHSMWQVVTVVSLAFAFAGGLGTFLSGKWLAAQQDAKISEQAEKISRLNEAAARQEGKNQELEGANIESQRALESERTNRLELERFIKEPRGLDIGKSLPVLLAGDPGRPILISYFDDPGAHALAETLYFFIDFAGQLSSAKQRPSDSFKWSASPPALEKSLPPRRGITLVIPGGWHGNDEHSEPLKTLYEALKASPNIGDISFSGEPMRPMSAPLMVVVGPKY